MFGRRQWLLGLAAMALAFGLAAEKLSANVSEEFVNEDLGFKCLVPSDGWNLVVKDIDLEFQQMAGVVSRVLEWTSADQECTIQLFVQTLSRERSPETVAAMFEEGVGLGLARLMGGPATINGYPAYIAFYDMNGDHTKAVVFVSGRYSYTWSAGGDEASLAKHVPTFDRMIESFRILAHPPQSETQASRLDSPPWPHLYRARGLGFTIKYPPGWEVDRIDQTTVQVTGPHNSEMADINAVFQTLDLRGGEAELGSALQNLRDQVLAEHPQAKLSEPQNLQFGEGALRGKLFIVHYYRGWDPMFQSVGVVTDREGHLYLLNLAGPQESVEANSAILNTMMASLLPTDR